MIIILRFILFSYRHGVTPDACVSAPPPAKGGGLYSPALSDPRMTTAPSAAVKVQQARAEPPLLSAGKSPQCDGTPIYLSDPYEVTVIMCLG